MDGPGALAACRALQLSAEMRWSVLSLAVFLILKIASPSTVTETEN